MAETDITIPPEAVKALRAALTACDCDECVTTMIRAAINAWPGSEHQTPNEWSNKPHLILPLPQEARDE